MRAFLLRAGRFFAVPFLAALRLAGFLAFLTFLTVLVALAFLATFLRDLALAGFFFVAVLDFAMTSFLQLLTMKLNINIQQRSRTIRDTTNLLLVVTKLSESFACYNFFLSVVLRNLSTNSYSAASKP